MADRLQQLEMDKQSPEQLEAQMRQNSMLVKSQTLKKKLINRECKTSSPILIVNGMMSIR